MLVAVRAMAPVAAKPPAQRRQHVGDALPDQFLIGIVARSGHAIGDGRRQQRLDRAEQGDRERRTDQADDLREVLERQADRWHLPRYAAKQRADRRHAVKAKHALGDGGDHQRDQRRRNPAQDAGSRDHDQQRTQADGDGCRMSARRGGKQRAELLVEVRAAGGHGQAEEVFQLADEDDQADARGEADDDRIGYVLEHRAHAGQTHRQQHEARQEGRHGQAVEPVFGGDRGQHCDKGAGRAGNLHPRTAEEGGREARHDRRVDALLRACARGDRKGHGKRQRDHAHGEAGQYVRDEVLAAEQARATGFENRDHAAAHGIGSCAGRERLSPGRIISHELHNSGPGI